MKMPKISLGSSAKKRYSRDMGFDNNTSMDFGFCQPLLSMPVFAGGRINVSYKQLVRLAPMPVPTFGRVFLNNEAFFVPIGDVVPYYDAMRARQNYNSGERNYVPTSLPFTDNPTLLYLLLCNYATFSIFVRDTTETSKWVARSYADLDDYIDAFFEICFDSPLPAGASTSDYFPKLKADDNFRDSSDDDLVTIDGADYVYYTKDGTMIYTFRLTNMGRKLRKIFIGLGYGLDVNDSTHVSLVPLLAYYKCWFDRYAPKRITNWLQTHCFVLIKKIENDYVTDFGTNMMLHSYADHLTEWSNFIQDDLVNTWYVINDDFISAHRPSPNFGTAYNSGVEFSPYTQRGDYTAQMKTSYTTPTIDTSSTPVITNVALQVLQRYTRYINKDSVIGQKLSDWLRVHLGADITNSLYKESNHISSTRVPVDVSDVFSTSDTAQETNGVRSGELLGSYAGKGIGFGKNGFSFNARVDGYVFVMSCIVPVSGLFQGNSFDLVALDNDTIPNPDYDALGYEITNYSCFVDNNSIKTASSTPTSKGFGFVPRYSGFKFKKNVVNGDFSRRGSFDTYSAYYLDRVITKNDVEAIDEKGDGKYTVTVRAGDVPAASEQWRYICRYDWLGSYDRIFYVDTGFGLRKGRSYANDDLLISDHFLVQTIFDVTMTDFLKPISQSWDTFEESSDTSNVDVSLD